MSDGARDSWPTVFVSHGAPTLVTDASPARDFLAGLGSTLGRPRAILCVSAHWEARRPSLGGAATPPLIHDFAGFPAQLYAQRYPAPGDPALASRAAALLAAAGLDTAVDPGRGLDHGAWVPLKLMYPDADVPVVQLSVQTPLDAAHHLALGRALRPLRAQGILILGSGGAVHNLRELAWTLPAAVAPAAWAMPFEAWLCDAVSGGRVEELSAWREHAPDPSRAHPTPEHFLPLFVPLGAATPAGAGRILHRSWTYGSLSMAAFAWD